MSGNCPFCELAEDRVLWSDDEVRVVADGFPVTPGHMLVITRRHVGSYFQTTDTERASIAEALDAAKRLVEQDFLPDGFNIGINDGPAAGQTVPHLHVHLMPRYAGDAEDPRGGVRWVRSETARYW
ncbi:HIT family hydrolase [Thiohalorhabdus denitrificans]|uniref:Diadenosine tetraphosphate (Ap4A) hydrolase n=1 Tax=Thiohalorhabdus denitrificans TaxID=381306 RepID=A0A0P9GMD5_9GAMM|nr:HIT family protein [Thiohalorhabdus denitrificans]KPV41530.1 HIT family hydrolase [Thiohalorhabdus denitrificans]SCY30729.1 Diadenosine tetraphosphate (Ap4A) hydrolase [Thiohalorhabdus denitrificans]